MINLLLIDYLIKFSSLKTRYLRYLYTIGYPLEGIIGVFIPLRISEKQNVFCFEATERSL